MIIYIKLLELVTQQKMEMTQEIERHKNKKYGKHINQQKL